MRCLSKTAAMRPANGTELLTALNDPSDRRRFPRVHVDSRSKRGALIATLVILVMLVGGAVWRARTASTKPPLIAVLPFETEGPGADSSFADGLRDAVTGKLARLTGLSVIDRKSVSSLTPSPGTSAQQAGKALGADYVLRASVRWAKGADGQPRVRVSPMLIRVSDGTTRWAGEPEIVSPADPFTIQASVATRVAEALDVVIAAGERTTMARRATSDTGAFAAVVRGKRISEENTTASYSEYEKALRYFENAYSRIRDTRMLSGLPLTPWRQCPLRREENARLGLRPRAARSASWIQPSRTRSQRWRFAGSAALPKPSPSSGARCEKIHPTSSCCRTSSARSYLSVTRPRHGRR